LDEGNLTSITSKYAKYIRSNHIYSLHDPSELTMDVVSDMMGC